MPAVAPSDREISSGGGRPSAPHLPVMVERVTELMAVSASDVDGPSVVIDCTAGAAGHSAAILAASRPDTHLIAIDRDTAALELAEHRLAAYRDRVTFVHAPFDQLGSQVVLQAVTAGPVLGVLYDLGVSSMQLDNRSRGFSFRADAPLDMRMDPSTGRTAADLIASLSERDLAHLLRDIGEERHAGRIARAVAHANPTTTRELADLVAEAVPAVAHRQRIHPATRTFQALRIAVNTELDMLSASLPQALGHLAPASGETSPTGGAGSGKAAPGVAARGGRLVTLAYHSLEDRIVKRFFNDAATGCICPPDLPVCACHREPLVTRVATKVERPAEAETATNPRARSARLRAAERTAAIPGDDDPRVRQV